MRKGLPEGYEKVSLINRSDPYEVWEVKERSTGKCYSVKTLHLNPPKTHRDEKLFLYEAKICKYIRHKNVLSACDTGCRDGVHYILSELCKGGSVDRLMEKKGGKLPLPLATYITLQLLSGLEYLHSLDVRWTDLDIRPDKDILRAAHGGSTNGIVHWDIEPCHILLSDNSDHPTAKITDFSMASIIIDNRSYDPWVELDDIPPQRTFASRWEIMRGRRIGWKADVWSAAACFYYMLTGQHPRNFRPGTNPIAVAVTEKCIPIRERDASIPPRLAAVIDKALLEDSTNDCQTAAGFRQNLIAAFPLDVLVYCRDLVK